MDTPFAGLALSKGDVVIATYSDSDDGESCAVDWLRLSGEDGSILWNVSSSLAKSPMHRYLKPISGCNGEVYLPVPVWNHGKYLGQNITAVDFNGNTLRTWLCLVSDVGREGTLRHSTRQREDGTEEDIFVIQVEKYLPNQTNVVAYSGTTGNLLWNASIAGDDVVHDFGPDGTVFALDWQSRKGVAIRNGYEAWRAQWFTTAVMSMDGTTYLQYERPNNQFVNISAIDMNGTQKWAYPIMDPTVGSAFDAQFSSIVV